MRDLLETELAASYGSQQMISVQEDTKSGLFGVNDPKACSDCINRTSYFYRSCEDKKVSKHKSKKLVKIICLEDVFQQFRNVPSLTKGGCCDILMYSDDKVVVMDMTCTRPEYLETHKKDGQEVEGKRDIVYRQIEDSVRKLRGCDVINTKLDSFTDRVAIFAVRKKIFAVEESETDAAMGMKSYSKMSDDFSSKMGLHTDMGNGFFFIVQEYPKVFEW
ncbi:MAG TPA: hypothetical protein PLK68_05335 [Thomasclavelia ramosa]|nr:hypothetical protein [Thomasclavelia ramosa]